MSLTPMRPAMAFIERRPEDDPTNWWAPSRACVEAMARSCGLQHELDAVRGR